MVCVALAAFVGVYVTEQLVGLLAPASAQVVLLKVPMPTVFEKVFADALEAHATSSPMHRRRQNCRHRRR